MYKFPQMLQKLTAWHPVYHRKITQKELADHVGVRPQTVALYLKGVTAPAPKHLLKMADFFCVSTDYLLTGQEKQNTAEDAFVIDPLRNIQQQASTLLNQTNYLIAKLEAKK